MPEQPDQATVQQIQQIARELAERHGLSEDETDEICGHLEDKLLAYMHGEIGVTREDALLLARAHFGDVAGVARQLAYQGDPPRPDLVRRRTIVRTAILTASFTLIGLPGALLLFGEPPQNLHDLLLGTLILLGCLAVMESGVLLAALTNLHSLWQRIVASVFLLPALLLSYVAIAGSVREFGARWRLPTQGGYAMIVAIELACLIGHILLLLLLAMPMRRVIEEPVPCH